MTDGQETIDVTRIDLAILSGHLKMGGTNPRGRRIDVNSRYWMLDGRPWLPVMGEFHFARYPHSLWRDELLKMKAGGVSIVSSYIFWIHHEEIENEFDWSGDRDLRRFVELCAELDLYSYPRLGPWCHGECRNGGLPDWVLQQCGKDIRKEAPLFLAYVRRLYHQIARQLASLLWKDGGPVIGVQLENEMTTNPAYLLALKTFARDAGIDVPLYTMTAWGGAKVPEDELIPMFGGYPDAFWDRPVKDWSRICRRNYFFSHVRDDNAIGSDLLPISTTGDLSFLDRYPYGTCEIGPGMHTAYHRRPIITADDAAALAMVKIGSGCNLQGYYMFHGGSNPPGKLSTLNESQATGYWNDLPIISYDWQAPIGEFGQIKESYHALRPLSLFLNDFGPQLAPMPMILPDAQPAGLDDKQTLRWSIRSDGRRGFIFINNYQRIESLPDRRDIQLRLRLKEESLAIPSAPISIPAQMHALWPVNLDLSGVLLKYATAQPICRIEHDGRPCYVFFAPEGVDTEFAFDARTVGSIDAFAGLQIRGEDRIILRGLKPGTDRLLTLGGPADQQIDILLLTQAQARRCWTGDFAGQPRLFLSRDSRDARDARDALLFDPPNLSVLSRNEAVSIAVFPAPARPPSIDGRTLAITGDGVFGRFTAAAKSNPPVVRFERLQPATPTSPVRIGPKKVAQMPEDSAFDSAEVWRLTFSGSFSDNAHELFLRIDYVGDVARIYLGDQLIADEFFSGQVWEIGFKRFMPEALNQGLTLKILPLRKDAPIYLPPERRPSFGNQSEVVALRDVQVQVERQWVIRP